MHGSSPFQALAPCHRDLAVFWYTTGGPNGSPRYHFATLSHLPAPLPANSPEVTALWACFTYRGQCMVALFEGSHLKTSSFSVINRADFSALEQGIRNADLLLTKVRDDRLRFVVELSNLKMIGRLLASRSSAPYRCHSDQPIRGTGGFYPTVVRRRLSWR